MDWVENSATTPKSVAQRMLNLSTSKIVSHFQRMFSVYHHTLINLECLNFQKVSFPHYFEILYATYKLVHICILLQ